MASSLHFPRPSREQWLALPADIAEATWQGWQFLCDGGYRREAWRSWQAEPHRWRMACGRLLAWACGNAVLVFLTWLLYRYAPPR